MAKVSRLVKGIAVQWTGTEKSKEQILALTDFDSNKISAKKKILSLVKGDDKFSLNLNDWVVLEGEVVLSLSNVDFIKTYTII